MTTGQTKDPQPTAPAPLRAARARLRAHLAHLARAAWAARSAGAAPLRAETAALRARLAGHTSLLHNVETGVRELRRAQSSSILHMGPFVPHMTIDQAWRRHPRAREAFARRQLPACDRCAVRHDETVEEAASAYGFALPELLDELNALLSPPRRPPHPGT
ncbi:MAG: hypothetical protein JNM72_08115 [Deltaproteobacteria bacterium]|nr:hypothetical protein [Deltaproteobacteria bacterium]